MQLIDINKGILNRKKKRTVSWIYSDGNFDTLEEENHSLESNLDSCTLEEILPLPNVLTSVPSELVQLTAAPLSGITASNVAHISDGIVISNSVENLERRVQELENEVSILQGQMRIFQNDMERMMSARREDIALQENNSL